MRIGTHRGTEDLSGVVSFALRGEHYDLGIAETSHAVSEGCCDAIGRLVDILCERGILSLEDASIVAVGYNRGWEADSDA